MKKLSAIAFVLGAVIFSSLFISSCKKEEDNQSVYTPNPKRTFSQQEMESGKQAAKKLAEKISLIRVYDEENDRFVDINPQTKDFSFSDPNPGFNFSNSDEVEFVGYPQGGGILYIGAGSIGSNTGGTVVAGNSVLDVNYTFCFAATDEALGLNFFSFGEDDGTFDGVSAVIGIAGNLESLSDIDEDDEDVELTDFFQGMAVYIVYDDMASGTYDVFDWISEIDSGDDNPEAAFGYVVDFIEPGIYFTVDGTLSVTGGQMTFQGQYFALLDFLIDVFEDEDSDPEVTIVEGFGTMGC